jgi:hypothetical protein
MKVSSWTERLLTLAAAVVITALAVQWAWSLLRPLVPFLVIVFAIYGLAKWHRR